jgi:hypothetical protein
MQTVGGAPHETATAGKSRNYQQTAPSLSGQTQSGSSALQLRGKGGKNFYNSNNKLPPKHGANNAVDEASEDSKQRQDNLNGGGLGTRGGSIFEDQPSTIVANGSIVIPSFPPIKVEARSDVGF